MPFTVQMDKELSKIINWTGVCVFPICLTISLPVILHNLVNEKEQRLVENMKINGMKMRNYWIVSGIYYFGIYALRICVYLFTGRYICELNVFTDTHMGLYLELLGCWGLCQIALAFFFCSFLNSAQTAAMSGYAIALYTCIIGGNMT